MPFIRNIGIIYYLHVGDVPDRCYSRTIMCTHSRYLNLCPEICIQNSACTCAMTHKHVFEITVTFFTSTCVRSLNSLCFKWSKCSELATLIHFVVGPLFTMEIVLGLIPFSCGSCNKNRFCQNKWMVFWLFTNSQIQCGRVFSTGDYI